MPNELWSIWTYFFCCITLHQLKFSIRRLENQTRKPQGLWHSCPCRSVIFHRKSLVSQCYFIYLFILFIFSFFAMQNWPFQVILSYFGGTRLEKIVNQEKLAISSHSEALQWCILVNFCCSDHSADHENLNVIQK